MDRLVRMVVFVCLCLIGAPLTFAEQVVVYTSVDQVFSEPILRAFERETGIRVKPLYDVEAAKTVGLANRLLAEKNRPKADVFWNSEVARTILLARKGVIEAYRSPHWEAFPTDFKDGRGYWTGFAARARILIYNTGLLNQEGLPRSIFELAQPGWKGKVTIANPLFGTTATHIAALYVSRGQERTEGYLRALVNNGVVVVDGNSVTRDMVVQGAVPIGFTDTDDANVAIIKKEPVNILYPDQDDVGTFFIPNTVALVKGGPNRENGKRLVDYLLSEEVESRLSFGASAQIPLRRHVNKPSQVPDISHIRWMRVNYEDVADHVEKAARFCQELFVK